MNFSIIAAIDKNRGIGKAGVLAWHLKGDMDHFKAITTRNLAPNKRNAVIMGYNTWISLPEKFRPLPDRLNIVLSWDKVELPAGVLYFDSLDKALAWLSTQSDIEEAFVIGGATLYKTSIVYPECQKLYLTEIDHVYDCDTFFPEFDKNIFKKVSTSDAVEEKGVTYTYCEYVK